jgi:hypothetical protein
MSEKTHAYDCDNVTTCECENVCEDCLNSGFVWVRVDVDLEAKRSCSCGWGEPNE